MFCSPTELQSVASEATQGGASEVEVYEDLGTVCAYFRTEDAAFTFHRKMLCKGLDSTRHRNFVRTEHA